LPWAYDSAATLAETRAGFSRGKAYQLSLMLLMPVNADGTEI